ncbi:helicase [Candidatus Omnitrophus magneticus]|uniref:DNA 5'-3' helicase n=1 Tax=Candidatus Omnitrophus magneticus TaxID=1609969 RepID=A0A0F0CNA0_9BACT|nr:helicase [Candidatus Omnitrophus magneticus]
MTMDNNYLEKFHERVIASLSPGGVISSFLPNYEARPEQIKMAEIVAKAIEGDKHLIAEAGTGTGKSLAYLVPFIFHAVESGKKIIISTHTKTLQSQLYHKDIPFLEKNLGVNFKYALCFGSGNYICYRRISSEYNRDLFESEAEARDLARIIGWSRETESGVKSDLGFIPRWNVWDNVSRDPDLCTGRKCIHFHQCFYQNAKKKERESDILVVNHSLFFTNLASEGRVLPNFHAVVFDEAHTLENVASSHLGVEISNTAIDFLFNSIYNERTNKGFLPKFENLSAPLTADIKMILKETRSANKNFWGEIEKLFGTTSDTKRIYGKNIVSDSLTKPLSSLVDSLGELLNFVQTEDGKMMVEFFMGKCKVSTLSLSFILKQDKEDYVYWLEIVNRRGMPKYSLMSSPIEVAKALEEKLFNQIKPCVLTSATLSLGGKFDFLRDRLGIKDALECRVESPFDYKKNVLLYFPKGISDPASDYNLFEEEVAVKIKEILEIMMGRTFILFTSYKMLNSVYEKLAEKYYGKLNLLKQGDMPRYELLKSFTENKHSVLLGNATFWQGIDVPGRALECVIITKLPFTVPTEPLIEARTELIKKRGKDPFTEYVLPEAVTMFKQGFGRLIRSKNDKGIVAVLDPRIRTKYYGRIFLNAIPSCAHTHDLAAFKNFLEPGLAMSE